MTARSPPTVTNGTSKRPREELSDPPGDSRVGDMKIGDLIKEIGTLIDDKMRPYKEKIEKAEAEIERISQENQNLKDRVVGLERSVEYLLKAQRRSNVIINGLTKENSITDKEAVSKLLSEELKVGKVGIVFTKRIGKNQETLLVELENRGDVHRIMKNAAKLKGSGIYIDKDLDVSTRKKRSSLINIRKALTTNATINTNIIVRGACMSINNTRFTILDGKFVTMEEKENGLPKLSEIIGVDVQDMEIFKNVEQNFQ